MQVAVISARYCRFCLVGATGVFVDMLIPGVLSSFVAMDGNLSLAKGVAAEAAITSNYIWNNLWTFRRPTEGGWSRWITGFWRFNLICLAGVLWSILLINLGVKALQWNLFLVNALVILLVSIWNFWLSDNYGWGRSKR